MKKNYLIVLFLLPFMCNAQLLLNNEEVVLQFMTEEGKHLIIAKDTTDNYLVYRYGTPTKVEIEYPADRNNSWGQFHFSWWLRGGGLENEGIDVNYLYFNNGNYRYVIYQEYHAQSKNTQFGVKVINRKSGKINDIKAEPKTIQGSLTSFRENDKIQEGEELFFNVE